MKNLLIKTLCAVFALLSVNFAFAKGKVEKGVIKPIISLNQTGSISGVNVVNTTGYTLSDIYIGGVNTPVEYFNLPTNSSHEFVFDIPVPTLQMSIETAGTGDTGPQYGIRIYDDNDTLIYDGLKQEDSRSHTITLSNVVANQLRIELYN